MQTLSKPQTTFTPTINGLPLVGNYLEWINKIADAIWEQAAIDDMLAPMLKLNCDRLICPEPTGYGWFKRSGDSWVQTVCCNLPECLLVDVESHQVGDHWQPFLAVALDSEGTWYCWRGNNEWLIPSTPDTLWIGHNASEHDSQFFESEYIAGSDRTVWLDTRSLVERLRGIHPDQRAQFEKFSKNLQTGKGGAPDWISKVCEANLEDAVKFFCGIQINKSVQGSLINGVNAPKTVFEYCCQDVWATLKLLQTVYPMARGMMQSNIWWYGKLAVTGLRYPVKGWANFVEWLRGEYEQAKAIKPADRSENQAKFVQWGASYLSRFESAKVLNDVMPLRVNPCDLFGEISSDVWGHWVREISMWDLEWATPKQHSGYPIAAMANTEHGHFREMLFSIPVAPTLSSHRAKLIAAQNITESRYLKTRCPQSLTDQKTKADWLQICDQPEVLSMFITVMDGFILEYEIDAWLAVPGHHYAVYAYRGGDDIGDKLKAMGEEAGRIIEVILKGK